MPERNRRPFVDAGRIWNWSIKHVVPALVLGAIAFAFATIQTRNELELQHQNALEVVDKSHRNELDNLNAQFKTEREKWRDQVRREASLRASNERIPLYGQLNDDLGDYVETLRVCFKSCLLEKRFLDDRITLQGTLSKVALRGSDDAVEISNDIDRLLAVDPLNFAEITVLQREMRALIRLETVECRDGPSCTDVLGGLG